MAPLGGCVRPCPVFFPSMNFDIAIIGAGVVGLAIAQALSRKDRSLVLLEKNDAFGRETSSRNSEIIHAGIYYPRNFLKSRLCIEGNRLLYAWCRKNDVPHRRIGKLIVATDSDEETELEQIRKTAEGNGVEGLEILGSREIRKREPGITARAAIFSPNTGIVDSHRLMATLLGAAERSGALLACRASVTGLQREQATWTLTINGGEYGLQAATVINSAGLYADLVAARAGIDIDRRAWRIWPCKGNYFAASPSPRLNHLVYPVPLPNRIGLGIHATLDLTGRVRFGPDSRYLTPFGSFTSDRSCQEPGGNGQPYPSFDYAVDEDRKEHFHEAIRRYLPNMTRESLHPDLCGIRPKLQGPDDPPRDFVIQEETRHDLQGLVNLLGIESPGLTSCLAIGDYVKELVDHGRF